MSEILNFEQERFRSFDIGACDIGACDLFGI